jgi:hypothetical protein
VCVFSSTGAIDAQFTFDTTSGKFYPGYHFVGGDWEDDRRSSSAGNACAPTSRTYSGAMRRTARENQTSQHDSAGVFTMSVPVQTIAHVLTIEPLAPEGHAPAPPSLTSGGACVVGSPHAITFTTTDPDGDSLRYGIDWDADGSVNEWVPPSGYVASGASQSSSRTYSMAGEKTIKVMAEDEGGLTSDWATLTFTCAETPPPASQCSDNADNDNDGLVDSLDSDCSATAGLSEFPTGQPPAGPPAAPPSPILDLRVIPSLVRSGNTTKVNWSAQNVQSCTVTAPNGDTWSGLQSAIGGETSSPITAETRYTLSCTDLNGTTHTKTATVRIIPTFQEL